MLPKIKFVYSLEDVVFTLHQNGDVFNVLCTVYGTIYLEEIIKMMVGWIRIDGLALGFAGTLQVYRIL